MEIRRWGEPPSFDFPARDHLALAEIYGWIDLERAAKVSGARFAYRIGDVALLELALYRFALDRLTSRGFTPVLPPVLVREEAMYGTGFFPTTRSTSTPSSATSSTSSERPRFRSPRCTAARSSKGRAAAAVRGLLDLLPPRGRRRRQGHARDVPRAPVRQGRDVRVHAPEWSREEHERLLEIEEELVQELGLPYSVVNIAAGDLGASAAKKYDIEAWFPSQERYREITSTSNTTDYQARRLEIRLRRDDKQLEPVHTLNGTAVTAARCSRSWRTSSTTTARSRSRNRCTRSAHRSGSLHELGRLKAAERGATVCRRRGAGAAERGGLENC